MGICFDPYSRVALDTFIQRSQKPIHALGEVHSVRGGKGGQQQEVRIEFIVMQAQERDRLIEAIYAS